MNIKHEIMMAVLLSAMYVSATSTPWARFAAESSPILPDDGHGTSSLFTLSDLSGNGNDGTIVGFAYKDAETIRGEVIRSTGWFSSCLFCSNPSSISRTYAAWVNRDGANVVGTNYADLTGDDPLYLLGNFAGLDIRTAYTGSTWQVYASGEKITALSAVYARRRWQHLALAVADSGNRNAQGKALCTVKLYTDGMLAASASDVPVDSVPSGDVDLMGRHAVSYQHHSFPAWIDDIRIYERELQASEVADLHRSTCQVKMVARFPLDEIVRNGGSCISTNTVYAAYPLVLGSQVYVTNGVEGAGALFFPGPSTAVSSAFQSYALYTNKVVDLAEDVMISFWINRSREQCTGAMRFLNATFSYTSSLTYPLPFFVCQNTVNSGTISQIASTLPGVFSRNEEWEHFAMVFSYGFYEGVSTGDRDGNDGTRFTPIKTLRVRTYLNGVQTSGNTDSRNPTNPYLFSRLNAYFTIANNEADWKAPARMAIDDMRIYYGQMDDSFVQNVYRGAAVVDAGQDFAVSGATAVLHGSVGNVSAQKISGGYAGKSVWTLVSCPAGGEGAAIESPGAVVTRVTLPVEGVYVFRLSNSDCGEIAEDTVTVTRSGAAQPSGCSATVAVRAASGLCAVVEATGVAPGARVRWMQSAGPGGAFFANPSSTNTLVAFSAAGTYTLVCEVSDATASARYELAYSATGTTLENQITNCLTAYWDCEISDTTRADKVAGYKLKEKGVTFDKGANFVPGVDGSYGIRVGYGEMVTSGSAFCYGEDDFPTHRNQYDSLPLDEWITVSLWMYHDGNDPMPCYSAVLANAFVCQGFCYLPKYGGSTDFEVFAVSPAGAWQRSFFKGLDKNLTNRWTHVVAMINQRNTRPDEPIEIWVDGCKLERRPQPEGIPAVTVPRLLTGSNNRYWDFGGSRSSLSLSYAFEGGPESNVYSHRFPGSLDEIRVYHRRLGEAEIRYLRDYPRGTCAELAPSVTVPLETVKLVSKEEGSIAASVFAAVAGASLSCKWSVVSGDASKVQISDATSLTPIVRFTKAGEYRLQLVVCDGARTAYSEPISFEVSPLGLIIMVE